MQLRPSYAWIIRASLTNEPDNHLLCQELLAEGIPMLIISLPALAKQPAEKAHRLSLDLLRGKLFHCLAPDFFLIGILKVFSARSIITSLA